MIMVNTIKRYKNQQDARLNGLAEGNSYFDLELNRIVVLTKNTQQNNGL